MSLLCTVAGHTARTIHHHNGGLDFTLCHHCGCDLIRADDGPWTAVPDGFRVVWREFGRESDAASVAARMGRTHAAPRRRDPRNARPKPKRDRRGRPLKGAASLFGTLASLRQLIGGYPVEDDQGRAMEADGQYVICLPSATG